MIRSLRLPLAGALVSALIGCGSEPPPPPPPPVVYYTFPWIEECKTELLQQLDAEKARNEAFQYRLIHFDSSLKPVPELRGYIEISSSAYNKEGMHGVVSPILGNCYPSTVRKIALRDKRLWTKLRQTRTVARGQGAKNIYARLSRDHLHVYFPTASKQE